MREYEVNTRVTTGGSNVFTLKGVSSYHRKEPFTISDIIYEILEQTWSYRKYNVVMDAEPHDALSRRLAALAKNPIEGAEVTWEYSYSEILQVRSIEARAIEYDDAFIAAIDLSDEKAFQAIARFQTIHKPRRKPMTSQTLMIKTINRLLNTTGINLTWFDWEETS